MAANFLHVKIDQIEDFCVLVLITYVSWIFLPLFSIFQLFELDFPSYLYFGACYHSPYKLRIY